MNEHLKEYKDLPEHIQQKLREKYWDVNVHEEWADFTKDWWADKLEEYGFNAWEEGGRAVNGQTRYFKASCIYSDVSYCQGSGSMFYGTLENPHLLFQKLNEEQYTTIPEPVLDSIKRGTIEVTWDIGHSGNYFHYGSASHDYRVYVDRPHPCSELQEDVFSTLETMLYEQEDSIRKWYKHTCEEMHRELEQEYEDLTSEKAIIEYFTSNNMLFDEYGEEVEPELKEELCLQYHLNQLSTE